MAWDYRVVFVVDTKHKGCGSLSYICNHFMDVKNPRKWFLETWKVLEISLFYIESPGKQW